MNKFVEALTRQDIHNTPEVANIPAVIDALEHMHSRFVDERVSGWTHPETGQWNPPVSREEAESRWKAVEPKFREVLLKGAANPNDASARRLGLRRGGLHRSSSDYYDTAHNKPDYSSFGKDFGKIGPKFDAPELNPEEYEPGWARARMSRGERGMADEPSLRRGESKASVIVRKMIG